MGKLIEKEGRFYKECGVVMLETTDRENTLWLNPKGQLIYTHLSGINKATYTPQHLYITSDDVIKDGDYFKEGTWFIDIFNTPRQATNKTIISPNDKEIIATFNTSLGITDLRVSPVTNFIDLPIPSDKFIQAYIDAYNKGEKIEKVLVECHWLLGDTEDENQNLIPEIYLKLKDNDNIIIKKAKDSWTREEVIQKLNDLYYQGLVEITNGKSLDQWIEENL